MAILSSRLCPICHQPTVPSSVGDICVHCDRVWPYNLDNRQSPPVPAPPQPSLAQDPLQGTTVQPPDVAPIAAQEHPATPEPLQVTQPSSKLRHRIKAHMRRLVVPELPNALDPSHELSSPLAHDEITPNAQAAQPVQAEADLQPANAPEALVPTQHLQAEVLAEEIAEQDTPSTNAAPDNTVPLQAAVSDTVATEFPQEAPKSSPKVLLGTIVVILLVLLGGAWLTMQARKPTSTPKQASSTAPRKAVSAEVTKRDAQRKQDLIAISTALEVYRRQQGSYPSGNDINVVYPLQYTTPPYISYINYDPLSSDTTKIKYSYSSDGTSFTLAAKLEDPNDEEAQSGYYIVRSK